MAARHQAARLDIPVVQGVYLNLQRHRPSSGQTPRTRFKSILSDLGLTATGSGDGKPLDLVSELVELLGSLKLQKMET